MKEQEKQEEIESSDTLVHEVDLSGIETSDNIAEMTQMGNYLVGVTDKGTKFRQHIPPEKVLNKKKGKWVLEDMKIWDIAQ